VSRDRTAERQLEVDVHVENAGDLVMALGVGDFRRFVALETRAQRRNLLASDSNIADEAAGGVDYVAALDDSVECQLPAPLVALVRRGGQRAIQRIDCEVGVGGGD